MKFELEPDNRGADDESLLNDLRSVASSLGKSFVTTDEYNEHGRWHATTFHRRFGSWTKAQKLAGLTPSHLGLRISEEELFENLEHLWEALGRQPRFSDFAKPFSKCSYDVYPDRFGSFRKALEAFVAFIEDEQSQRPEESRNDRVPEATPVCTAKPHRTSRTISWRMRFLVMRRDNFRCCNCGVSPALKPGTVLVVDHISAWSKGGETVMENLQTLCEPCNGGKSDLPMQAD